MAIKKVKKRGEVSWQYDVRDPHGKRVRVHGFSTKKDAEDAVAGLRMQWLRREHELPTKREEIKINLRVELKREIEYLRSRCVDHRTRHHGFAAIKLEKYAPLFPEELSVTEIGKRHLNMLIQHEQDRGVKPDTINLYLRYFKSALKRIRKYHAEELDEWLLPPSEWFTVTAENVSRQKIITNQEIVRILNVLENPPLEANIMYNTASMWRDTADLMRIAMLTGMRKTEIISLEWKDVHFGLGVMKVNTLKQKNGKVIIRDVPILDQLENVLKCRRKSNPRSPLVFPRWETDKQSQWIYRALAKACKLLKIPYGTRITDGVFPHAARHTAATVMLINGTDVKTASEVLGNTPETLLRRYAHTTLESKKRAIKGLTID